ncbi:ATP-grasp domain-containing protein [Marinobacter metalliresistant]|uniref:ATP-grasp domain-containing protein n=1 Tax=Marinobacter metalliresistant TaxID=2961995 RepID=A0ABZ2W5M4_9GAMM
MDNSISEVPYVILIGGGVEACEGIRVARQMGLKLIVVDGDPHAPGFELADLSLSISTYDGQQLIRACRDLQQDGCKIIGVIAMCADVPVSVAAVAQALGLPGLSLESACWVADKLLMKQRLEAQGIPIPGYAAVKSVEDMGEQAALLGLPLVVKPVDSRGARGVLLIDEEAQFEWAYKVARDESPTGRVMVEEYLPGPQFSTETLVDKGQCYTVGFSDRNYEWLEKTRPHIIENGGDAPTALSPTERQQVVDTVEKAALALNIRSGVAKGDMVLTPRGPKVIEIAGRLSGGYFSTTQIPLATGVNFVEQAIRLALGETLQPSAVASKWQRGVAIRYLDLPPGRVSSVTGEKKAASLPGVEMLRLFVAPGDYVPQLGNHTQRPGFVIATAETKELAVSRAQRALAQIRIDYAQ